MVAHSKLSIHDSENDELLGYVQTDGTNWQALTLFGSQITRTTSKAEAEAVVREKGLSFLMGVWQYYDKDDHDWFPCVIKEAYEHKVIVHRTNVFGYEDNKDHKRLVIENPTEDIFVKSA